MRLATLTLICLLALAGDAQGVVIRQTTKTPVNVFTLRLLAQGTHNIKYGTGGGERSGEGSAPLNWKVELPAPLAWPTAPAAGTRLSRSIPGALTATGTFTDRGTANLRPPDPPPDAFFCSGNLSQFASSGLPAVTRLAAADKGFAVAVPSFSGFGTGPGSSCTPPEAGAVYYGNNLDSPTTAVFKVSQATLKQPVVELPVNNTQQGLGCGGAAPEPCSQAISWTGTVRLEKRCRNGAGESPGGVLGDPDIACSSPCKGASCTSPVLGTVVPKQIIKVRDSVEVKVECYGGAACRGRSKMFELKPGRGSVAARRSSLATGRFSVRPGRRATLRLKLTRAGRRRVKKGVARSVSIRFALAGKRVGERTARLPARVRRR